LTINGASMTQGIVEGNNEVLSAPLDDEKETLKLQAAKASQETSGQSEEGLKKKEKEKERLKKKRSDRMDTAKSVAASFPMVQLIDEVVKTSIPPELVAKVREAQKHKKRIMNPSYPHATRMDSEDYASEMELLQIELVKMQAWLKEVGERIVIIFEGRDAAGKGGTIKTFSENLNPRGARVVALTKPSETERGQWYFQRYIENMPTRGEIVMYDRSWYNRGGVEHVMGFCSPTSIWNSCARRPNSNG
jgi:polyphosphate kinase